MRENKQVTLYKNMLSLVKEINEAILIDTLSEPFNHQKYLPAVLKPLLTNESVIRPLKGNRLRFIMAYFLSQTDLKMDVFLNKDDFEELFPLLKNKKERENLSLIFHQDVLENEEKYIVKRMSPQTGNSRKNMKIQKVSDMKAKNQVRIVDIEGCPSIITIDDKHTMIKIEEDNTFLIHFNANLDPNNKEGYQNRLNAVNVLKEISYPFALKKPIDASRLIKILNSSQLTRE